MLDKVTEFSSKRIYRIGISFIVCFIAINILVAYSLPSYSSTGRASEILLDENLCNFVDQDFKDIQSMLEADENPKIFLLGDSISYGIGVEDESEAISSYLRKLLKRYSVYNLSSCGSKPLDYYLWIKYLSENDEENSNMYMVQYNYKWFNSDNGNLEDRISQKKILYHFWDYLDDDIKQELDFDPGSMDHLASLLKKNIPVSANNTKLLAKLTNEKSKEDFIEHMFFGKSPKDSFDYKKQNWREKSEMMSFNCKIAYSKSEWDAEKNFNYSMYLKTLDFLNNEDLNAFVFLPAYNYEITKKCQNDSFEDNVNKFKAEAGNRGVSSGSYIGEIDEEYFLDDMHLSLEGNKVFANKIVNSNKGL